MEARFATTPHRAWLFGGFLRVVEELRRAGCITVFLDGSFITAKPHPGDFDGLWDLNGVDPDGLDPVLFDFDNKRAAQKAKYFGEMFLMQLPHQPGLLPFFQKEKYSDEPKGIVRITLGPALRSDPMITNEKQYRSARAAMDRIGVELTSLKDAKDGAHPVLRRAQIAGLQSQVSELDEEVREYEHLQTGAVTSFEAEGLADLPEILIRARIARGMSQRDLGIFVGVAEQQIQRYEAERYRSASLERLSEIAAALDITMRESAQLRTEPPAEDGPESVWSFPVTEMYNRGYFEDFSGSAAQARKQANNLIPIFFRHAAYDWSQNALHRRSVRAGANVQQAALAAWEARVAILAERRPIAIPFDRYVISHDWLHHLVGLSARDDGPQAAMEHLRASGVAMVIEPHLPGTLLDGAALQTVSNLFVVALTLRHDRLDNFWFTLLHEIAHLALHVGTNQYRAIFDETESPSHSPIEEEADRFAYEALIPSERWKTCVSRFTRSEKAVRADAAKLGIHQAIVAGRIRREANDYTLLPTLVGSGQVRRQLT